MARRVVYLSGGIAGLSYAEATESRNQMQRLLADRGWDTLNPMRGKELLSSMETIEEGEAERLLGVTDVAITQRDYDDLDRADVLIVLSGNKASFGTCFEWALAHFVFHKPVIVVCDKDSPTRRHPWCKTMAGYFADSVEDAADFLVNWLDRAYQLP